MSVAVAVMSGPHAALAADSLHVELTQPASVATNYRKLIQVHIRGRGRASAVVGVADIDGEHTLAWVGDAIAGARASLPSPSSC